MSAVYTPTRYKLTVEDYHKLGEVGILNEDSRVELIEGELIQMAPIGGPHARIVTLLNRLLVMSVGQQADVAPQNALALSEHSEPQPDFAILRRPVGEQAINVPKANEVLLVVEVADTTLRYDRGAKRRLYAEAGIPEFWIVDVKGERVECYREPIGTAYARKTVLAEGDRLTIQQLPGISIAVGDIFPAG